MMIWLALRRLFEKRCEKSFSVSEFIGTSGLCEGLISVFRCDHSLDDLFM